ncbi:hypothetical protein ILUMI_10321 [Ignelater luminosus]|uniref:Uncharacterized protein n=1 Tax=Ignelater luminosus TaxID=2038154 RepID=A0A8K0GF36_IGNLU|nr:hypothetical protein ILUMI_10321 [Ignelater luminosus]
MSDNEVEQLASFMGHTMNVHKNSYRLPDDVYQTAKISKLLLLMESGSAGDFKGQALDEIEIDMEENLLDLNQIDPHNDDDLDIAPLDEEAAGTSNLTLNGDN